MGRITPEDRILIKELRQQKRWGAKRLVQEFPQKSWSVASVNRLLKRISDTGTTERKKGTGRVKSVRIPTNIKLVTDLICSQENQPHSHQSPREIERDFGISRSSVRRIIKHDIQLKTFKRVSGQVVNVDCKTKRLERCQQLLMKYPTERSVRGVWFTDEKLFTVAAPVNAQNDRVYSAATHKRNVSVVNLVRERQHFSKSVMVSVGVSLMGKTSIVFVQAGAKINSQYYCEMVLGQGLLPDIRQLSGHGKWTLQQDGAPSHTARNTLRYLQEANVDLIEPTLWPPNSPDLNPVDYAVWGALQQLVYKGRPFKSVDELKEAILESWNQLSQTFIDRTIKEWRRRLQCVVEQNGGHIEHLFK